MREEKKGVRKGWGARKRRQQEQSKGLKMLLAASHPSMATNSSRQSDAPTRSPVVLVQF